MGEHAVISKLKFWSNPKTEGPTELPMKVANHLTEYYGLDAERVSNLRCLTKSGWHLNKRVTLMRVFDPVSICPGGPSIGTYDSLMNYRTAIMFEGHTTDDELELADRRAPAGRAGSAGN
jgi:hypothetical protein